MEQVISSATLRQRHIMLGATEELKLDGYRMQALKLGGKVHLRSRRGASYTESFPDIVMDLNELPEGSVIDGELAALDAAGRPRLGLLQNHRTSSAPIVY